MLASLFIAQLLLFRFKLGKIGVVILKILNIRGMTMDLSMFQGNVNIFKHVHSDLSLVSSIRGSFTIVSAHLRGVQMIIPSF